MHFDGICIAFASFLIIGMFHPIVIKSEYYFGVKIWPIFAIFGMISLSVSIFISSVVLSAILGVLGCTFFWSIIELYAQRKRVERGWFPKNPKRRGA